VEAALKKIKAKTMVIGITTDILFPLREQQFLADVIPGAQFRSIHSSYGHDGFLLEYETIEHVITDFIGEKTAGSFHRKAVSASNSNL
jgi:homoserine O-acetyltransferase